jgi:type II secretory pathway pseudopilin PulG
MNSLAERGCAPYASVRASQRTAQRTVASSVRRAARKHPSSGFSFVELLVTMIIAAIAFAAMVPLFVGAQQKASGDKARSVALNIAQDRIEKIRQLDFDQITKANLESSTFAGGQFGKTFTTYSGGSSKAYNVAYDLKNAGGSGAAPAYVRVRVTVTWAAPPGPVKPVELQTYVSRQYAGPQITDLELTPLDLATGEIRSVPLTITATVAPGDRLSAAKVLLYVFGENGMLVKQVEIKTGQAGNTSPGVYTMSWDAAGAGDGKYSFRAQAYTAAGDVGNTWARAATLNLTNGILQVTGLTATPGDGVATLAWTKVVATKFSHYELWRGATSGGETKLVDDLTGNGYTDSGLVNGQTYYYVVYAVNVDGVAGPASNEVSVRPVPQTDVTPPTMPGGFTAVAVNNTAVLSWTASTDLVLPATGVKGYYVYRSDNPSTPLQTLGPNATGMIDAIGWVKTYSYYVKAFDGAALVSVKTATISVTTSAAPKFALSLKNASDDWIDVWVRSETAPFLWWKQGTTSSTSQETKPAAEHFNGGLTRKWGGLPYDTYTVTSAGGFSQSVSLNSNMTINVTR